MAFTDGEEGTHQSEYFFYESNVAKNKWGFAPRVKVDNKKCFISLVWSDLTHKAKLPLFKFGLKSDP